MTRWEAYTTVCSYLRAGLLVGTYKREAEVAWELIIEVASFHYATATLAACFDPDIDVPSDVRNYFESALAKQEAQRANSFELGTRCRSAQCHRYRASAFEGRCSSC
jgi:hypothetical protein